MDVKSELEKTDSKLNFTKIVYNARKFWWVYALITAGCIALGAFYIHIKPDVYGIYASVIFNDDDDMGSGTIGGLGSLMASFNMGGAGRKFVEDEQRRMGSHSIIMELVKNLNLNVIYTSKENFFATKTIYFEDSPISVFIPEEILVTVHMTTLFKIDVPKGGKNIKIKVKQGKKVVFNASVANLPANIKTPRGTFRVDFTKDYNPAEPLHFKAILSNPAITADDMSRDLDITARTKKTAIIDIDYKDANITRGKTVVNSLISIYNRRLLEDYKSQAQTTVEFLKERISQLYNELETSEQKISNYKKANRLADASAEAEYIYKLKTASEANILEYETKASVINMILDFISRDNNKYSMIPFAADIPSDAVTEYNKLILERMRLLNNAKGNNAALKAATEQVDAMRTNLTASLEKELSATKIALADVARFNSGSDNRISQFPEMEKELFSLYRDQKLKNQIYTFLLQKLEESQMRLSRDTATGKIIDEAFESIEPIEPKKPLILIAAFIFGLCASFCCVQLLSYFLNKRKRKVA